MRSRKGEIAVDGSRGVKGGWEGVAEQAEDGDGESDGRVVDFKIEVRLRVGEVGDVSGEQKMAVAGGQQAGEIVECLLGVVVCGVTASVDIELVDRSEFEAVRVGDAEVGTHSEITHVPGDVSIDTEIAAPSAVGAEHKAAYLAKLRAGPLGVQV